MKINLARLPPFDDDLAPTLADSDRERRIETLRRIAAEARGPRSRLAAAELHEIETKIREDNESSPP